MCILVHLCVYVCMCMCFFVYVCAHISLCINVLVFVCVAHVYFNVCKNTGRFMTKPAL